MIHNIFKINLNLNNQKALQDINYYLEKNIGLQKNQNFNSY